MCIKLIALFNKISDKKNGNRARQLVNLVAKHYESNPKKLLKYLQGDYFQSVKAIASSAYGMLTEDLGYCQQLEYGGWGISLDTSESDLEFGSNQLWFAKLSGDSLRNASISDNAGWYAKVSETAGWYAEIFGNAFRKSTNRDDTFMEAQISDDAFWNTINSGNMGLNVRMLDNAGKYSRNDEWAFTGVTIFDDALLYSENFNHALHNINNQSNNEIKTNYITFI